MIRRKIMRRELRRLGILLLVVVMMMPTISVKAEEEVLDSDLGENQEVVVEEEKTIPEEGGEKEEEALEEPSEEVNVSQDVDGDMEDNTLGDSPVIPNENTPNEVEEVIEEVTVDEEGYYLIDSTEDFLAIRDDLTAHYRLTADIDFAGTTYEMIGTMDNGFTGELDGNGFTISNIKLDNGRDNIGLFGSLNNAYIHDIDILSLLVRGNSHVGGIATKAADSHIENIYIQGEIFAQNQYAGGLFADSKDMVYEGIVFEGGVRGNNYVGGIAAISKDDGYKDIDMDIQISANNDYIGGLIGQGNGIELEGIEIQGVLSGNNYIGGIAGDIEDARIHDLLYDGRLSGCNQYAGGFFGRGTDVHGDTLFAYGEVQGNNYLGLLVGAAYDVSFDQVVGSGAVRGGNENIGGLVGYGYDITLSNGYAITAVNGVNGVAGILGRGSDGNIDHLYMLGSIQAQKMNGVIGSGQDMHVHYSFFDQEVYHQSQPNEQARTTEAMKQKETYVDWDFDNVWEMTEGSTYPVLSELPVPLNTYMAYYDLSIREVGQYSFSIKFNPTYAAENYEVEVNGSHADTIMNTTYEATGLEPGTDYTIRVRAKNSTIEAPWSEAITLTTIPLTPTNIQIETSSIGNRIDFDSMKGASSYEVDVLNSFVDTEGVAGYLHTDIGENMQYVYRVRSINPFGKSPWSEYFIQKTLPGKVKKVDIDAEKNAVHLSWDPISGSDYYEIKDNTGRIIETQEAEYRIENLQAGQRYSYQVRAYNGEGFGEWSKEEEAYTQLDEPTNIDVQMKLDAMEITYSPVSGATLYQLRINGVLIDNGNETSYHYELENNEIANTIQVKAMNEHTESQWTKEIIVSPLPDAPIITEYSVREEGLYIEWMPLEDVHEYELVINETSITVNTHAFTYSEIEPGKTYSIKVRGVKSNGQGAWTELIEIKTELPIPSQIVMDSSLDYIQLTWAAIDQVDYYELVADGVVYTVTEPMFKHEGLSSGSLHVYRIRAISGEYVSSYTSVIEGYTQLGAPALPSATYTNNQILIRWGTIMGATAYDVEVNGQLIEDIGAIQYTLLEVPANTAYSIRVRAKNTYTIGAFSDYVDLLTSPGIPEIPEIPEFYNVYREDDEQTYTIVLHWFEVEGATSYDLEVDGEVVERLKEETYEHHGLLANTAHAYRIRATNAGGSSEWSERVVLNTPVEMKLDMSLDEYFNFVFVVPGNGTSRRVVTVKYDGGSLDIDDLCGLTTDKITEVGEVEGTALSIQSISNDTIVFELDTKGNSAMNIIKFKVLNSGFQRVTYEVE